MVVCWACGKEVLERDGYCEKCGFFLRDGSAVEVWVDHKGNVVDWDELIRNWEEEIKGKEGKKAGDVKLCIGVL